MSEHYGQAENGDDGRLPMQNRSSAAAGAVADGGPASDEEMLVDDLLDDIESAPSTGRR